MGWGNQTLLSCTGLISSRRIEKINLVNLKRVYLFKRYYKKVLIISTSFILFISSPSLWKRKTVFIELTFIIFNDDGYKLHSMHSTTSIYSHCYTSNVLTVDVTSNCNPFISVLSYYTQCSLLPVACNSSLANSYKYIV